MNVTLVRPTTFLNMNTHPLNIGYIHASLSSEDYLNLSFVDGDTIGLKYHRAGLAINENPYHPMWKQITREISATKPDMIAFSCYSLSMTATKYITNILREEGFAGQIWAGGIHPTTCPSETLENIDGLDGVMMGEGEVTVKEICKALHNHEPLSGVTGIAFKQGGEIKINPARTMIANLDDLPNPTRDFAGKYAYPEHVMLTSRGCPFNCAFCDSKNMWTRTARYRSGEHVVKEIKTIAQTGMKTIGIRDDIFTLHFRHVAAVTKAIVDNKLDNLTYGVGSRIDTMRKDMISYLKQMNVNVATFGVETGSPTVQKRIIKDVDVSAVVPTILKTNEAGIRTVTFFMLGHPGETVEDINHTYSLIRDLSKHCGRRNAISLNIVCPYPGTGYWHDAEKKYDGLEFIDFYKNSYKYYHQAKPFVNITAMEDEVFYEQIDRVKRLGNRAIMKYRFRTAVDNPSLLAKKIKNVLIPSHN